MVPTESDFAANIEVCPAIDGFAAAADDGSPPMEEFATQGLVRSMRSPALKLPANQLVKTMYFSASDDPAKNLNPVAVLLRGSDEVNVVKLKNHFKPGQPPLMLTEEEVSVDRRFYPEAGGPVGLKIPILLIRVKTVATIQSVPIRDDFHLKNVNHGRDFQVTTVGDFRLAKEGDASPDGKGKLKAFRGIEVGHIFYLGTKYSRKMQAMYLAQDQPRGRSMGCYGIGISRTVQAVIEQNHDKDGIIWLPSIAPYAVHIALLDPDDANARQTAELMATIFISTALMCF